MGEYLIKDLLPLKTYKCELLFDNNNWFDSYVDALLEGEETILEMACGSVPEIKKVIFNEPATIVLWSDGTKTVVRCQDGDKYSKETGLAMAIAKKAYGNSGRYNDIMKKWCE